MGAESQVYNFFQLSFRNSNNSNYDYYVGFELFLELVSIFALISILPA